MQRSRRLDIDRVLSRIHAREQIMRRLLSALTLLLCWVTLGSAQSASLLVTPRIQFFDSSGDPINAGFVCTLVTGTSTPLASYTDSTAGTANANPVVLDSAGRANIWLGPGTYRIILHNSGTGSTCNGTVVGSAIYTIDGVEGPVGAASGTANRVTKFTGGATIGNANMSDDGTTVTVGASTVNTTGLLYVAHTSGNGITASRASADATGVIMSYRKSRGTLAVPDDVTASDVIFSLTASPYSGQFFDTGVIDVVTSGTVVSTER